MFGFNLNGRDKDFKSNLNKFISLRNSFSESTQSSVSRIIERIKNEGDSALIDLTNQYDGLEISDISDLFINEESINSSVDKIDKVITEALTESYKRIESFHQECFKEIDISFKEKEISRKFRAIESVLLYVPGGKASYPSTVLMSAGPAVAAGVKRLILTSPRPAGRVNDLTLAAAKIAGIKEVFSLGGVQAIAAFALGTETIPKVDKIVGPGNQYVAEAKRQLYGQVGIDGIAGPSEIVILADETSNPLTVSWDLMAQAEHDELASAVLISTSEALIKDVVKNIQKEVRLLPRSSIITDSLRNRGGTILVGSSKEACEVSNILAPEHLHIVTKDKESIVDNILNAGLILVGEDSTNSLSDYVLGPSHVLPTGGSSRFSSPLSIEDFIVSSSYVNIDSLKDKESYNHMLNVTSAIASSEGLMAHAIAAKIRKK
jgi:histidinol dehydrogenase